MENFGIDGPLRKLITSEYYAFMEINDVVSYGGDYERARAIALDDNKAEDISLGLGSPSIDSTTPSLPHVHYRNYSLGKNFDAMKISYW